MQEPYHRWLFKHKAINYLQEQDLQWTLPLTEHRWFKTHKQWIRTFTELLLQTRSLWGQSISTTLMAKLNLRNNFQSQAQMRLKSNFINCIFRARHQSKERGSIPWRTIAPTRECLGLTIQRPSMFQAQRLWLSHLEKDSTPEAKDRDLYKEALSMETTGRTPWSHPRKTSNHTPSSIITQLWSLWTVCQQPISRHRSTMQLTWFQPKYQITRMPTLGNNLTKAMNWLKEEASLFFEINRYCINWYPTNQTI